MHTRTAYSYPHRWPCTRGRHRQSQRLHGTCGLARCHARYRRQQPLCGALRPPEQGALGHAHASYAMHMHASHQLLSLTNIALTARALLHPHGLISPDTCDPAPHTPQAYRPLQGHPRTRTRRLHARSAECTYGVCAAGGTGASHAIRTLHRRYTLVQYTQGKELEPRGAAAGPHTPVQYVRAPPSGKHSEQCPRAKCRWSYQVTQRACMSVLWLPHIL